MSCLLITCSCDECLMFNRPKKEGMFFFLCPTCWHITTVTFKKVAVSSTRSHLIMVGGRRECKTALKTMRLNKRTIHLPLNFDIVEFKKRIPTANDKEFMYQSYKMLVNDVVGLTNLFYKRKDY